MNMPLIQPNCSPAALLTGPGSRADGRLTVQAMRAGESALDEGDGLKLGRRTRGQVSCPRDDRIYPGPDIVT
jgi:hypothetical protein